MKGTQRERVYLKTLFIGSFELNALIFLKSLKDAQFEKMVGFLIEEPTIEDSNSRQFRFPFISCEMLTC